MRAACCRPHAAHARRICRLRPRLQGAHNRENEFTFFSIYPRVNADGSIAYLPAGGASAGGASDAGSDAAAIREALAGPIRSEDREPRGSPDSPVTLRCLNVVRTKLSSERRRGADVKALAIGSRYGLVDQLRPLIRAALEAYFVAPRRETLEHIVAELNGKLGAVVHPSMARNVGAGAASASGASDGGYTRTQRAVLRGVLPVHSKSLAYIRPPPLAQMLVLGPGKAAAEGGGGLPLVAADDGLRGGMPDGGVGDDDATATTARPRGFTGSRRSVSASGATSTLEAYAYSDARVTVSLLDAAAATAGAGGSGSGGAPSPSDAAAIAAASSPVDVHLRVPLFLEVRACVCCQCRMPMAVAAAALVVLLACRLASIPRPYRCASCLPACCPAALARPQRKPLLPHTAVRRGRHDAFQRRPDGETRTLPRQEGGPRG